MNINSRTRLKLISVLSLAMIPAGGAFAVVDKFVPFAYVGTSSDSNTFRTSDNEEDETISHVGAGVQTDYKMSRQHLLLDVLLDRAIYDTFDELDHTKINGTAAWKWGVGSHVGGDLSYRYKKELSSFNEQFARQKDMRTNHTGNFDMGYRFHPDWQIQVGIQYSESSYQKRDRLDRSATSSSLEVVYKNTLNTRVGIQGALSANNLNDSIVGGVSVDNDYEESTVSGVFYWEGSGKSSLEAKLGYTTLDYNELKDREYEGYTGRLTYHWEATGKTKLDFSTWRETDSQADEISSYTLEQGVSVKASWSATRKIKVNGEVSYKKDDFKADNQLTGVPDRDDNTKKADIRISWAPRKFVRLSAGFSREERDSSIDARNFTDDLINAKVHFRF